MAQTTAQLSSPGELEKFRQALSSKRDPSAPCISICAGAGCLACGAAEVMAAFAAELKKQNLAADVDMKGTGCPGFCEKGPVVVIHPEEICYLAVTPEDVPEIVTETIGKQQVLERLVYVDEVTGEPAKHEADIPF
jgi:(2Fe-2S) ferredoxin